MLTSKTNQALLMPAERYFLDESFQVNQAFEIQGAEFHHLVHVMRCRKGDQIELVNGKGGLAKAVRQMEQKIVLLFRLSNLLTKKCILQTYSCTSTSKTESVRFYFRKRDRIGCRSILAFSRILKRKKRIFPSSI